MMKRRSHSGSDMAEKRICELEEIQEVNKDLHASHQWRMKEFYKSVTCIHIHTHTYIHSHTHIYTHTHTHIYTLTRTYMHIYIHSHVHTLPSLFWMWYSLTPVLLFPVAVLNRHNATERKGALTFAYSSRS